MGKQLAERVSGVARYDKEIELWADYRPKRKVSPKEVWQVIADVTNITLQNFGRIFYARQLVAQCEREDLIHYNALSRCALLFFKIGV